MIRRPPRSTLFPLHDALPILIGPSAPYGPPVPIAIAEDNGFNTATFGSMRLRPIDRKSTRLNSSHLVTSYAVSCSKNNNPFSPAAPCGYILHTPSDYSH